MPVRSIVPVRNSLLTINAITREAVSLFSDSNRWLEDLESQYGEAGYAVGDVLRIRLPSDYGVQL